MALQQARRGRRWALFLAVLFGLTAAVLTWLGLQQVGNGEGGSVREEVRKSVVYATKDIPPRTTITGDMVEVRQIPSSAVHPRAVTSLEGALGQTARQTIHKGDDVTFEALFPTRAEAGLAFVIPVGRRAVSVPVSEIVGSGGMIVPADHVDIVAICRSGDLARAAYALQNIEVLAVGQVLTGEEAPSTREQAQAAVSSGERQQSVVSPPAQPGARSVTLAVDPSETASLLLYGDLCSLRLALRRFDDQQVGPKPAVDLTFGTIR